MKAKRLGAALSVIMVSVLGGAAAAHSQARRWTVSPYILHFKPTGVVKSFLPPALVIPPLPPPTAAHGVLDSSGNLLFYVINEPSFVPGRPFSPVPQPASMLVVDSGGHLIENILPSNGGPIAVFAVPDSCDQFYIVYSTGGRRSGGPRPQPPSTLVYSVVDLAARRMVQQDVPFHACSEASLVFAVGRLGNDGSRFLYAVGCRDLTRYIVDARGISLDSVLLGASLGQAFSLNTFSASQATLSSDGGKLAWATDFAVYLADLGTTTNLRRFDFQASGLAFSPLGDYLFLSPASSSASRLLSYLRIGPRGGETPIAITGSEGYAGSVMQLAADGRIYVAGAGDLGAIDPRGDSTPAFTPAAVPGVVAGVENGTRGLPYQINGEAQLTCENLCGNPAMIQSTSGKVGNFELVVPHSGGGIAHYWRDNDNGGVWNGPTVFGKRVGAVDAVSLIESGWGNLEVVARAGDQLVHFWRVGAHWNDQLDYIARTSAAGTLSFIERISGPFLLRNFEVVTPLPSGEAAQLSRGIFPLTWSPPVSLPPAAGVTDRISDVSLIQGRLGSLHDNLELVARAGDQLFHFWQDTATQQWFPPFSSFAPEVSAAGVPSLIQSRSGSPGTIELVTPLAAGGMQHLWRDGSGTWHRSSPFGSGTARSVALIQGNLGPNGDNLELVARVGCRLVHYWRDSSTLTWNQGATLPESCDTDTRCSPGYVCETTVTGDCGSPERVCVPGCRFGGERRCAAGLQCFDAVCKTCPCPDTCADPKPCNTPLDPKCEAPRFCDFPIGAGCGGSGKPGLCVDRPDPTQCPPGPQVCGCDGRTYPSTCAAAAAAVSVASAGPCPPPPDPCIREVTNGGFELGSTSGWNVDYGTVDGTFFGGIDWDETPSGQPAPEIITAASKPISGQGLSIASYCGSSMLRINDLDGGWHATRLWQQFKLPDDFGPCSVLRIHWGAMLQDPGHDDDEQPFFEIEALKEGTSFYYHRAHSTNAAAGGWTDVRDPKSGVPVWYRHALDTIPLTKAKPGDDIEIRLTAADCGEGGHGGAAFLDCIEIIDRCAAACPCTCKQALGELLVPNVFTPNGDGINDVWGIGNASSACTASAKIYDRWGVPVAEPFWINPSAAPSGVIPLWDGLRTNGTPASQCASPYYYVLKVTSCGETRELPGFVYLCRTAGCCR